MPNIQELTIGGPRYYEDEMGEENFKRIEKALTDLNDIKIRLYDGFWQEKYAKTPAPNLPKEKTAYKYVRDEGYKSTYANIIIPVATGILKSQESNQKNYITEREADLLARHEKIQNLEKDVEKKKMVKNAIVTFTKTGKWIIPYDGCGITIDPDGICHIRGKKPISYEIYERRLEERIRRANTRVKQMKFAFARAEDRLEKLRKSAPQRAIFGGRSFFKLKDTTNISSEEWKQEFIFKRHDKFTLGGRADLKYRNAVVKWYQFDVMQGNKVVHKAHNLEWELPDGSFVTFKNFLPVYRKNDFIASFAEGRKAPVSYSFELHRDGNERKYVLIKVGIRVEPDDHVNDSSADGYISVDTNTDHFAWTELSSDGKLLSKGKIYFSTDGLTTGQTKDVIGRACRMLNAVCIAKRKPLVMENLDPMQMRMGMKYKNPKRNKKISIFACTLITRIIESQAQVWSYAVLKVNPKNTSLIGKLAYMRKFGLSSHQAAAYVIGLKALGIEPEIPDEFKPLIPTNFPDSVKGDPAKEKEYAWKRIKTALKGVDTHKLYRKPPEFPEGVSEKEALQWLKGKYNKAS